MTFTSGVSGFASATLSNRSTALFDGCLKLRTGILIATRRGPRRQGPDLIQVKISVLCRDLKKISLVVTLIHFPTFIIGG